VNVRGENGGTGACRDACTAADEGEETDGREEEPGAREAEDAVAEEELG
jgi:hypothetical protein